MSGRVPATLLAALADVMKWLDAAQIPSMVIGGVAASMLGRARLTQDVDALVILPEIEWAKAMAGAADFGIVPRIDMVPGQFTPTVSPASAGRYWYRPARQLHR
jgi:hypothetical protein